MDWLCSSLENGQQARLPMWLLITQIDWKDLLKYRKYGRRLASALMNQLAEV
jgi:mediator of RNA polymerase II transcription subunit 12